MVHMSNSRGKVRNETHGGHMSAINELKYIENTGIRNLLKFQNSLGSDHISFTARYCKLRIYLMYLLQYFFLSRMGD